MSIQNTPEAFCHECGGRGERHDPAIHERRRDPRLVAAEARIAAARMALPAAQLGELIHSITLRLDDGSGTPVARTVFFRSWPGSGRWWSDPVFAVRFGGGTIVHRRAIAARGDNSAPTVDLPLESGIAPFRDAQPHLLGWAEGSGLGRGIAITADPADADPRFADRPSPERDRLWRAYEELFQLEEAYADLRDDLAPLRQAQGERLAPRGYPLTDRSDRADLFGREQAIAERLRAVGESTTFPNVAHQADLWSLALRRGLVARREFALAQRLAGPNWSRSGD